jgi:TIR domain
MAVGRLYDDLCEQFGDKKVFRDLQIPPGSEWRKALDEALQRSAVQLVLIGPEWPVSRLADPNDQVRQEIEAALGRDIPVIPILLEGAVIENLGRLPESIEPLKACQAISITDGHWKHDLDVLVRRIEQFGVLRRIPPFPERNAAFYVAAALVVALLVSIALLLSENGLVTKYQAWPWVGEFCRLLHGHFLSMMRFQYMLYGVLFVVALRLFVSSNRKRIGPFMVLSHWALGSLLGYTAARLLVFAGQGGNWALLGLAGVGCSVAAGPWSS